MFGVTSKGVEHRSAAFVEFREKFYILKSINMDICAESADAQINRMEEQEYRDEDQKLHHACSEECADHVGNTADNTRNEAQSHETGIREKVTEITGDAVDLADTADHLAETLGFSAAGKDQAANSGNCYIFTDVCDKLGIDDLDRSHHRCDHREQEDRKTGKGQDPESRITDRIALFAVFPGFLHIGRKTQTDMDKS